MVKFLKEQNLPDEAIVFFVGSTVFLGHTSCPYIKSLNHISKTFVTFYFTGTIQQENTVYKNQKNSLSDSSSSIECKSSFLRVDL